MPFRLPAFRTLSLAIALGLPVVAAAQSGDSTTDLDEVIVTGTRTEVAVQDSLVPAQEAAMDQNAELVQVADWRDKKGEEHYNTVSAFIKSMRASQGDAALYYLARMVEAGENPLFIARRMVVFASEDIGLAQPTALVVANAVFEACQKIGYPECAINLAHGVAYLAESKKSRKSYDAYFEALDDVRKFGNLPIPLKVRNAPTKLMKGSGYGDGYIYDHDTPVTLACL